MRSFWGERKSLGANRLARVYLVSLVTIAGLTVAEQAMMASAKAEHDADAKYLTVLDRQMTLTQRIGFAGSALTLTTDPVETKSLHDQLGRDLQEFKRFEAALVNGSHSLDLPMEADSNVQSIYKEIRSNYWGIRKPAELMIAGTGTSTSLKGLLESSNQHQEGLSKIQSIYRTRTDSRLRLLQGVEPVLAMLILCVLMFEFLFVFKPEIQNMQKTSQDLAELNDEITESLDEVRAQREELSAQQEQLQAQQSELETQNLRLVTQQSDLEELNRSLDHSHEVYADAARRMEALFQGVPAACFSFEQDGTITDWNRAAEDLFGHNAYEVMNRTVKEMLDSAMGPEILNKIATAPFQGRTVENLVWSKTLESGAVRWTVSSAFPVFDSKGDVVGAICSNTDVTERTLYQAQLEETMVQINEYSLELEVQKSQLEEANLKLQALATTDGLTGLRNHRSFQERLEADVQRAIAEETHLSLLLLDVDRFKVFNDTYGHPEGDKVLKAVGAVLSEFSKEPVTVARYGGEEFVVALPATSEADAITIAEEIRTRIEAAEPTGVPVTASIGLATWASGMRSRAQIIAQADKALYRAKADGRNRVVVASSLWADEAGPYAA